METFPSLRLKRIRQTKELRNLSGIQFPPPSRFVWPIFIKDGSGIVEPITSLPGQSYVSVDKLPEIIEPVINSGVKSLLLFGVVSEKDKTPTGEYAYKSDGPVQQALTFLRNRYVDLSLFADTGLSGYTTHGHAGVEGQDGYIDNDTSLEILQKIALTQSDAGATCVAPSGMMDGQVAAIRQTLDQNGHKNVLIMSYSTKFHSNLYSTFPYAISHPRQSDLRTQTYLANPYDPNQAIREATIDEQEAADILMVKPALFYLDIIQRIRSEVSVPLAAYSVSGEYSMIKAAAQGRMANEYKLAKELLLAISRAGADIIISYWANAYEQLMKVEI